MIPVLYEATETNFKNNGIGKLSDAIVAEVEEAINGVYELFVKYPVNGAFFDKISLRSIIKAKPNTVDDPQAFRVYRITKPINGIVTIYARHLAYDLSGVAVSPFTSQPGVQSALLSLQQNMEVDSPFEFRTTKSDGGEMKVSRPSSAWSLMGGTSGSLLDTYGGEWSYDNYVLTLNSRRGADNGVAIRYGKNLTDLEQDSNCANCYTGVYPYWQIEDEIVTLTEKIIYAEGEFDYTKILPLDLTERFETAPTEEQLRTAAENYIENNNIGVPDVSWKVEFVALEDTEEYKGKGFLERISLGDTVKVVFDKLGVNASARAVETVYNVIAERYESITLGRVRSNLAQTIVEQQREIEKKPNKSLIEKISDSLAAAIMGLNGGSVRLLDTNADGEPDTLYIADNPDPAQAVKVWRFNYEGWAASSNGYNGPFIMGATLDDGLLASFVTAANLVAGTIQSQDGKTFFLDLDNGVLNGEFSSLTVSGKTVDSIAEEKADDAKNQAVEEASADAKSKAAAAQAAAIAAAASDASKKSDAAKNAAIAAASVDAAQKANNAEENAKAYADAIDAALNQLEIFNRITNNGSAKGIYLSNGQLYINATYLKSGTISSDLINVLTLFAKDITMTGTFTNTTNAFLEPNQQVVDRINRHLLGTELISSAEKAKYDFDNDGDVDITDLVLARAAALGNRSFANWSGAVKTPVTCTINLSNPARALVMAGTDMWGNYRESVIGVDPAVATFASREHLDSIVQMNATGNMYRMMDGEEEWFNPYMEEGVEYRTVERYNYGKPVYCKQIVAEATEYITQVDYGIDGTAEYIVRINVNMGGRPIRQRQAGETVPEDKNFAAYLVRPARVDVYSRANGIGEPIVVTVWYTKV